MRLLFCSALLSLMVHASAASAQHYPHRPIRVVMPFTAGSAGDNIMRLLAPTMEEKLGQKLIIEAKPGAAGNIGTLDVIRSAPDGYTVLVAATSNFVINQFVMKQDFDPLTALVPVAKLADIPLVIFANPSVPANTFTEFLAYAKANPGKLNFGSPSAGSVAHLVLERVKSSANLDMMHVPFRGSPQGVAALLANDIQLFTVGLAAGAPHLKAGKLKALAVISEHQLLGLPGVGTLQEAGLKGLVAMNWWGMAVPKGTPDAIVKTLSAAVSAARKDPNVIDRYNTLGMIVPQETRKQFAESLPREAAFWSETAKQANITPQ